VLYVTILQCLNVLPSVYACVCACMCGCVRLSYTVEMFHYLAIISNNTVCSVCLSEIYNPRDLSLTAFVSPFSSNIFLAVFWRHGLFRTHHRVRLGVVHSFGVPKYAVHSTVIGGCRIRILLLFPSFMCSILTELLSVHLSIFCLSYLTNYKCMRVLCWCQGGFYGTIEGWVGGRVF